MLNFLVAAILSSTAVSATPPAPAVAAQAPVAPADKIRCKRYTETGSLAHVTKECHTEKEWHDIAESARRNTTQFMDNGAIHSGGGPQ